MDWDLKIPPWNLQEMENQQQKMNNASVDVVKGLDLKLGASGELLGSPEKREGSSITRVAVPVSSNNHNNNNNNNNNNNSNSNSNSSKRVRAPSNASQNVACLVDGCKADLSGCREYHRRHKVCEAHSKTPVVLVGGREQRFCQQCSRFHLLMEFDEVKRSCRKRLDGHNRRRRKPQPDPSNSGSLFPVHQGPRYSFPHIFTTPTSDPSWTAVIKNDEDVMNQNNRSFHLFKRQHHSPPNSTFQIFKGKGFPFLHDDDAAICGGANVASSACQPLAAASSSENCNRKIFSNGLPNVLDTNCALSLLSSPSHTASINLGPVVPVEGIPFGQLAQQFGNQRRYFQPQAPNTVSSSSGLSCSGMDTEQVGNILIDGGDNADLNCHGLYSVGGGGALDGHSVALPFSW